MTTKVKCPTCQTDVVWNPENKFRPFCSERCKLIDLGEWASESHCIEGEQLDPEAVSYLSQNNFDGNKLDG